MRCAACRQTVAVADAIQMADHNGESLAFHKSCLACDKCKISVLDTQKRFAVRPPLGIRCSTCIDSMRPTCKGCGEVILGSFIRNPLNRDCYHKEHCLCVVCGSLAKRINSAHEFVCAEHAAVVTGARTADENSLNSNSNNDGNDNDSIEVENESAPCSRRSSNASVSSTSSKFSVSSESSVSSERSARSAASSRSSNASAASTLDQTDYISPHHLVRVPSPDDTDNEASSTEADAERASALATLLSPVSLADRYDEAVCVAMEGGAPRAAHGAAGAAAAAAVGGAGAGSVISASPSPQRAPTTTSSTTSTTTTAAAAARAVAMAAASTAMSAAAAAAEAARIAEAAEAAASSEQQQAAQPPLTDLATAPPVLNIEDVVKPIGEWKRLTTTGPNGKETQIILGQGGNGKVVLGERQSDGLLMAVKIMRNDGKLDYEHEVQMLINLRHRCVVELIGFECTPDTVHLFMEYIVNKSVRDALNTGRLHEARIRRIVHDVLSALEFLHSRHTIHRDVKPHNILLTGQMNVVAKLGDFGSCKPMPRMINDITMTGYPGTYYYLAPELLSERYSTAVDIWALGCTIIEMATAQQPWADQVQGPATMHKISLLIENSTPTIPTTLSDAGQDFVRRCCVRDASRRATATELLAHPWMQNVGIP
jgi:tRNA A-37 threonylcarbamoyl transferase component Bud32